MPILTSLFTSIIGAVKVVTLFVVRCVSLELVNYC
jgi:hypothetical protein